jgi:DNA-binding MarR family transcriptional regulator
MYLILRALWEKDQRSQQELADDVFKDKASLTKLVVNLEKRGLIYRTEGELDRRSKIVALTAEGRALRHRVYPIVLDLIETLETGFSTGQLVMMQQMLEKMYARLKR